MACKFNDERFNVNQDFPTIYQDFIQSILKDRPEDVWDYGAYYFEAKLAVIFFF